MEQTCKQKSVFTKGDYESSDGMLTYVWGPCGTHYTLFLLIIQ